MQWIDTHVHLFTDKETSQDAVPLYGNPPALLTASHYLASLPVTPDGVVVVDFSRAPDPAHVVHAMAELNRLNIPAKGIIRGTVSEQTMAWLKRSDVCGLRLYALDACPGLSEHKDQWESIFNLLRHHRQHIVIYGQAPYLLELVKRLPNDIPLAIDHLGMPDAEKGHNDSTFNALLQHLSSRNKSHSAVYFKGPGYRSHLQAKKLVPFLGRMADALGEERLLMGTSDAPFAKFEGIMTMEKVTHYIDELTRLAGVNPRAVLYENAKALYGF